MGATETNPGTRQSAASSQRDGLALTPASCAEYRSVVDQLVDASGATFTYHGRVLDWDVAKSRTIELEFAAPWYSDRAIELFVWSESGAKLQLFPEDAVAAIDVSLEASSGSSTRAELIHIDVPLTTKSKPNSMCVTLVHAATTEPKLVSFGLAEGLSGKRTAAIRKIGLDSRTFSLGCMWMSVVCALFAIFAPLGSYGFVLVGLPAVPALLKYLGIDTAIKIDITALSLWLYVRTRSKLSAVSRWDWEVSGPISVIIVSAAAYVLIGLITPLIYADRLEDTLNSPLESMQDLKLFCKYPERLEARALLARRFALIRSESDAWGGAIKIIRDNLGTDAFLDCLEKFRFARFFHDSPKIHEDEARAFYSALIFYEINSLDEFPAAMTEIRRILYPKGTAAGQLSELAWHTFTTRMEKNIGEKAHCKDDVKSKGCAEAQVKCEAADKKLEHMLGQSDIWSHLDRRQNTIYIEARDVAASARLSVVCSAVAENDVRQAINHYEAMLGAIPGDPRLDRPLSAINLRFMAESMFYPRSPRIIVQSWVKDCANRLKRECALIQEVIIGSGDRKFFLKDRIANNLEWDKASLAQANFKELREFVLSESRRNWRKPWASGHH